MGETLTSGEQNPSHLVLDSTYLYWVTDTQVRRMAKTGGTPEKQAEARENLQFLNATINSRLASTQLDIASDGMEFLGSILKVVGKVVLATAIGL